MRGLSVLCLLSIIAITFAQSHSGHGLHARSLRHRRRFSEAGKRASYEKRAESRRCRPRTSTSTTVTSTLAQVTESPQNTQDASPSTSLDTPSTTPSSSFEITSTQEAPQTTETHDQNTFTQPDTTSSSTAAPTTSSSSEEPEETSTQQQQQPTSSSSAQDGGETASPGSGSDGETHTGEATFYNAGLGACGITNTDSDYIVAVSTEIYDNFPGYDRVNPNNNPICGKQIQATYEGKSITVTVTDRCGGCAKDDLDFTPTAFSQLADQSKGRLSGMTWVYL